ncbi:MAG: glycosyltransferase family 39 protein [Anaerolineae bacterium]|nr:glycosyltransferase family 39 protein [Anaerolineae bacterium]
MVNDHEYTSRWRATLDRWWPALLLAGLWLFQVIANWVWLSKNVVMTAFDRIAALSNSLFYYDTFSEITLRSLFKATIQDEIRPPLFAASMAIMQKLLGVSTDVAVMVNAVYMGILLAASYGIGTRLGGRRTGLISAALVAFTPMVFSMSRYAYFEFTVAAFTALSIYLLLTSERFEKRGFALLLGPALGLGLLTKRTFPVFVVGALLVVFFQAALPQKLWARLKSLGRPRWRDLLLALLGGVALSALWYFPNQAVAQTLAVGFWVFPIWATIYGLTIFFLLQPPSAVTNFLSCSGLAASVASLWYVPRVSSFIERILRAGWGVDHNRQPVIEWTSLSNWTYYLNSFFYGFSPVFTLLLLLAIGLLLVHLIRRSRQTSPLPRWNSGWWAIIASLIMTYFIFTASVYKHDRAITPALPFLGIILAGALCRLPWRRLGTALASFAIVFGVIQFFAISYTELHVLAEQTRFPRLILGQSGLFAQGPYLELADSGINDPGWHISPDVLQRVEQRRKLEGWDSISCGILADNTQLHIGIFFYDYLRGYPAIQVEDPARVYPHDSVYSMSFVYDYVLLHTAENRDESMHEAVGFILGERRPWFEQAFELEHVYPMPDGSDALLFRRRHRPESTYNNESLYDIAQYLHQAGTNGDRVLVYPPGMLNGLLKHYWGPSEALPVGSEEEFSSAQSTVAAAGGQTFVITDDRAEVLRWLEGEPAVEAMEFGDLSVVTAQPSASSQVEE